MRINKSKILKAITKMAQFGPGQAGELSHTHDQFRDLSKVMLGDTYKRTGYNIDKTIKSWRGANDPNYRKKVFTALGRMFNPKGKPLDPYRDRIHPSQLHGAIAMAETGHLTGPARMRFTEVMPKPRKLVSTAYGPTQITLTRLLDMRNNPRVDKTYLNKIIAQGRKQHSFLTQLRDSMAVAK